MMNCIKVILSLLLLISWSSKFGAIPTDICQYNNGNIDVTEAVLTDQSNYLWLFTPNKVFKVKDFNWDRSGQKFTFGSIEELTGQELAFWNVRTLKLLFQVDYPGKGKVVVAVHWTMFVCLKDWGKDFC